MHTILSKFPKVAVTAAALTMALGMAFAATPTQAAADVQARLSHFEQCLIWLGSDPAKHAEFCSPGHDVFVSGSTGTYSCDPCDPCCRHYLWKLKKSSSRNRG
ncbi:MAG: hypothetical protein ABI697_07160 [Devosia sp.]